MRRRHQNGRVELTKAKTWKAHWYEYVKDPLTGKEKRLHRSQIVGAKAKMTKWEAEDELDKIVAPLNTQGNSRNDDRVTLEWFWKNRFKPMREGGWGPATKRGCETDWSQYLKDSLGQMSLKQIDLFSCQKAVNDLAAKDFSESVVKRVRTMISSILELASELEFLPRNPAAKIKMPVCKPTRKPVLQKSDLVRLLKAIKDPRDHLIIMVGAFCALTSSELFGITWECFNGDHIEIRNTAYQGEVYEWRVKRKTRFRKVPLPAAITAEFENWKKITKKKDPTDLVFPGRKGKAMWTGIFLEDHIKPIATALGITTPITFQVLRRSCATRNQKHGSLKDVQAHMGHSNIQTTGNVYMQEIPDSVVAMVNSDVTDVLNTKPPRTPKPPKQEKEDRGKVLQMRAAR